MTTGMTGAVTDEYSQVMETATPSASVLPVGSAEVRLLGLSLEKYQLYSSALALPAASDGYTATRIGRIPQACICTEHWRCGPSAPVRLCAHDQIEGPNAALCWIWVAVLVAGLHLNITPGIATWLLPQQDIDEYEDDFPSAIDVEESSMQPPASAQASRMSPSASIKSTSAALPEESRGEEVQVRTLPWHCMGHDLSGLSLLLSFGFAP